jgi:predicted MFS family arabinose efflux permease
MSNSEVLERRRWALLGSACLSFFAVGCTFFAVPPLVPELVDRFSLTQFQVGLLMGAISVPAIFLSIPLGAAIDRWAARAAGNWGLALMVIGGALFAISPNYLSLLLGRLLFGIGGLLINLLVARLITTAFAGRELAMAMGIFSAVYPASMIIMFSLHPRLIEILGWRLELIALAALALVAAPLHNLVVPKGFRGTSVENPRGAVRLTTPLIALAFSWMFFFAAFAPVITFAPQWIGTGPKALLTVSLIMWTALILSPVIGKLIDRTGKAALWGVAGLVLLGATMLAMAFHLVPPSAAMILIGCCTAIVPTATYALPGRLVAPAHIGFAFGFITAFSNLGTLLGPSAFGFLRDQSIAWTSAWCAFACLGLIGAAAMAIITKGRK